jgi:hypothetical protein
VGVKLGRGNFEGLSTDWGWGINGLKYLVTHFLISWRLLVSMNGRVLPLLLPSTFVFDLLPTLSRNVYGRTASFAVTELSLHKK